MWRALSEQAADLLPQSICPKNRLFHFVSIEAPHIPAGAVRHQAGLHQLLQPVIAQLLDAQVCKCHWQADCLIEASNLQACQQSQRHCGHNVAAVVLESHYGHYAVNCCSCCLLQSTTLNQGSRCSLKLSQLQLCEATASRCKPAKLSGLGWLLHSHTRAPFQPLSRRPPAAAAPASQKRPSRRACSCGSQAAASARCGSRVQPLGRHFLRPVHSTRCWPRSPACVGRGEQHSGCADQLAGCLAAWLVDFVGSSA